MVHIYTNSKSLVCCHWDSMPRRPCHTQRAAISSFLSGAFCSFLLCDVSAHTEGAGAGILVLALVFNEHLRLLVLTVILAVGLC